MLADRDERSRHLPGDELVAKPIAWITHAITIRLIERGRVRSPYRPLGLPMWLARRLGPLAHSVMVRRHMVGIATRAETLG